MMHSSASLLTHLTLCLTANGDEEEATINAGDLVDLVDDIMAISRAETAEAIQQVQSAAAVSSRCSHALRKRPVARLTPQPLL